LKHKPHFQDTFEERLAKILEEKRQLGELVGDGPSTKVLVGCFFLFLDDFMDENGEATKKAGD